MSSSEEEQIDFQPRIRKTGRKLKKSSKSKKNKQPPQLRGKRTKVTPTRQNRAVKKLQKDTSSVLNNAAVRRAILDCSKEIISEKYSDICDSNNTVGIRLGEDYVLNMKAVLESYIIQLLYESLQLMETTNPKRQRLDGRMIAARLKISPNISAPKHIDPVYLSSK